MNQREKLALGSWMLNEIVDTLHVLVTFSKKALIWLSVVHGNTNNVAHFTSCYGPFLKIEAHIEIIFKTYCFLEDFSILFSLNKK